MAKKKTTRKKKSSADSGWGAKQMFGGLILAFGVLLLVGILYMAVAEGFEPRALRGLVLPFAMIGMGIAWRWELLGGLITIASIAAFYAWDFILSGRPPSSAIFIVLGLPGLLFVLASILDRDS